MSTAKVGRLSTVDIDLAHTVTKSSGAPELIDVTKDEFFETIGGPEDVRPVTLADRVIWVSIVAVRLVVAVSFPGYRGEHGEQKVYKIPLTTRQTIVEQRLLGRVTGSKENER